MNTKNQLAKGEGTLWGIRKTGRLGERNPSLGREMLIHIDLKKRIPSKKKMISRLIRKAKHSNKSFI